jgi:hypothetical protein
MIIGHSSEAQRHNGGGCENCRNPSCVDIQGSVLREIGMIESLRANSYTVMSNAKPSTLILFASIP